ncbi:hypothetical protein MAPG_03500 [Magnaporthiopsis poae ATCC 64411]|uniref:Uncharacterized protein n=1 Tax=Magnaporthiopsis poae (strain ATCC 64411 / 73-15) TaxID=644358 RepID=A0A0C4DU65_MAGP6|nr:hypothetical protein MAPG_03500 [Magnaporthiopsis poae ATCC 64411]
MPHTSGETSKTTQATPSSGITKAGPGTVRPRMAKEIHDYPPSSEHCYPTYATDAPWRLQNIPDALRFPATVTCPIHSQKDSDTSLPRIFILPKITCL